MHEAILGQELQRDTFRRAMEPHLEATGERVAAGRGRPAELFRARLNQVVASATLAIAELSVPCWDNSAMERTIHHRLHLVEAADWKDGVITLLAPDSPYRPWRYAFGDSRPGDYAVMVLGTDPVSVLTLLGRIDHEGGLGGALFNDHWLGGSNLVDLATLATVLDLDDAFTTWRFTDDDAERVILALHESRVRRRPVPALGPFVGVCSAQSAALQRTM